MHTLGYGFKPWTDAKAIADGPSILAYLRETVTEFGIDRHIRFRHAATGADLVQRRPRGGRSRSIARDTGETQAFTCRHLFMCSGYYSYRQGYTPEFLRASIASRGRVVHPQGWPDDLDVSGQRVVVIGSGATAMTLVPGAGRRGRRPRHDAPALADLRGVPARPRRRRQRAAPGAAGPLAYRVTRRKNIALQRMIYRRVPHPPAKFRDQLLDLARKRARPRLRRRHPLHPDLRPVGPAALPDPQRRPVRGLSSGQASVVTDRIDTFTERGITLESGAESRGRHRGHRHRSAARHARRDGLHRRRRRRSTSPRRGRTRASPTRTCRTWRRRSATSPPRGRCAPT